MSYIRSLLLPSTFDRLDAQAFIRAFNLTLAHKAVLSSYKSWYRDFRFVSFFFLSGIFFNLFSSFLSFFKPVWVKEADSSCRSCANKARPTCDQGKIFAILALKTLWPLESSSESYHTHLGLLYHLLDRRWHIVA